MMNQADIDRATPLPDHSNPNAVYTYYGLAAWWAQMLEVRMLDLVAAIQLADGEQIDGTAYKAAFENLDRQTLGLLLGKCRNAHCVTIPDEDKEVLQESLQKRNYLIHRFFAVHGDELLDDPEMLVKELRELSALFAAGYQAAQGWYLAILGAIDDLDPAMIETAFRLGGALENIILKKRSH